MMNNNYNITIMITMLAIFIVAMIILSIVVIVTNEKHKKKIEEISLYQINTSANIDASIPHILEIIIEESFADYQVKSLVPLNEGFINTDREAEIRKELVNLVSSRISNAALDKLSLYYNIKNIADIMADKIYILIMNYVIEHNKGIE